MSDEGGSESADLQGGYAVTLEDQSTQLSPVSEPANSPPSSGTASPAIKLKSGKVDVLLKATGDAPIMKKKKWAVDPSKKIGWIIEFIKKYIKAEPSESVFLYVNQSFAPAPDVEVGTVYDCFGSDGKLVLHYCRTQAWG
ncbi:ubiquitin-like protein ATG12 [Lingula anatina]|uniref:Ubiquitin-like protein ATG12 n=1 Tax=Lingula anatina TaxID=7574 RepID=A0A1S3ILW0_LINAN|nr:ubiquitin-like protein ATG12 [Lingula anatina]|eukprot:XP_013399207.1 ubiquitin-like protein ATG12 [Lingula anatina]